MATQITSGGIEYTVTKLESGNILIEHRNPQYNPLHGPDTEGVHAYEVHPCQRPLFNFWNKQLPEDQQQTGGEGRDGAAPWWSLVSARPDTATRSMRPGARKQGKNKSGG